MERTITALRNFRPWPTASTNAPTCCARSSIAPSPSPRSDSGSAHLLDTVFDDFDMTDMLKVPVTVVAYDADEVGRRAAQLLLDRTDRNPHAPPGPARRTVVPTSVVRYGA
ncbi:substrate-binding domain-containing protein [Streptomyces sp. NPDC056656]|uniref:substrate-binding domain-containing protein n=1 Tax=Streptomyces sp. NPDC056656 TaxID=3345895 RepID=UPI0036A98A60